MYDLAFARGGVVHGSPWEALAALRLHTLAGERQQSTPAIAQSRDNALATLAAHVSPTGQDALLQTLDATDATTGRNVFCDVLTEADQLGLAGHVYLRQGEAAETEGRGGAELYAKAAEYFMQARMSGKAAHTFIQLARACENKARFCDREAEWRRPEVKPAYTAKAKQCRDAAAVAWRKSAAEAEKAANFHLQADEREQAITALQLVGDAYLQVQEYGLAAQACVTAAGLCQQMDWPKSAARAWQTAGHALRMEGQHERGAQAFDEAAELFRQLRSHEEARQSYTDAAQCWAASNVPQKDLHMAKALLGVSESHMRLGAPKQASDSFLEAQRAWAVGGTPGKLPQLTKAFLSVAQTAMEFGQHAIAADLYRWAGELKRYASALVARADAAKQDGKLERAADSYERIATMHEEAGEFELAAENLEKASDLYKTIAKTYENNSHTALGIAEARRAHADAEQASLRAIRVRAAAKSAGESDDV